MWCKSLDRSSLPCIPKFNLTGVWTHDDYLRMHTVHFISMRCLIKLLGHYWLESFIWESELMICYKILYFIVHAKFHKKIAAQLLFLSALYCPEKANHQIYMLNQSYILSWVQPHKMYSRLPSWKRHIK